MAGGEPGPGRVREAGFAVEELPEPGATAFHRWLRHHPLRCDAFLFDVRSDLGRADLEALKPRSLVAVLDDPGDKRLAADLAFYPPVDQMQDMAWPGFSGTLHVGFDWIALDAAAPLADTPGKDAQAAETVTNAAARPGPLSLLVTMGGTDPHRLSLLALKALALVHTPVAAELVVGTAMPGLLGECLELAAPLGERVRIVPGPVPLGPFMQRAQAALCAFGVTAYELAAQGVATVLLGITPDHARSADCLARENAAINVGYYKETNPKILAARLDGLFADSRIMAAMGRRGRELGLGRGAVNIARAILDALEKRR
jgi:spore coat polysaccharide biosynthesis protein SpsF